MEQSEGKRVLWEIILPILVFILCQEPLHGLFVPYFCRSRTSLCVFLSSKSVGDGPFRSLAFCHPTPCGLLVIIIYLKQTSILSWLLVLSLGTNGLHCGLYFTSDGTNRGRFPPHHSGLRTIRDCPSEHDTTSTESSGLLEFFALGPEHIPQYFLFTTLLNLPPTFRFVQKFDKNSNDYRTKTPVPGYSLPFSDFLRSPPPKARH